MPSKPGNLAQLIGFDAVSVDVLGVDKKKRPLKKRVCQKKETRAAMFLGACLTDRCFDCLAAGLFEAFRCQCHNVMLFHAKACFCD